MASTTNGTGPSGMSMLADPESTDENDAFAELGSTGLNMQGGHVYEEFLPALKGQRFHRTISEMSENDSVIGGMLFGVDMLMRQADWFVEPAEGDDDVTYAEFVETCRTDMSESWEDTLSQMLGFLPHGWQMHEIVLKRRQGPEQDDPTRRSDFEDNLIGWRKMPIRSQETLLEWDLDLNGGINGMWQLGPPTFKRQFLPIERCLLLRTTTKKGNPEGRSILRNAYVDWFYKTRVQHIEAVGIERDLAGIPVGWVPWKMLSPNATPEEITAREEMKKILRNLRRDEQEAVIWPQAFDDKGHKLYDLTLLSTGGRRQFDTDKTISRYDQRVTMSVLADFLLLGHEKVGSYALGASKVDLFTAALEAWMQAVAGVFNRHAIPRLLRLNGMDVRRKPRLTYGNVQRVDLAELGGFIKQLTDSGMPLWPDERLERHVRSVAGLPEQDDDPQGDLIRDDPSGDPNPDTPREPADPVDTGVGAENPIGP